MGSILNSENLKNAAMVAVGIVIYYAFVKKITDTIIP